MIQSKEEIRSCIKKIWWSKKLRNTLSNIVESSFNKKDDTIQGTVKIVEINTGELKADELITINHKLDLDRYIFQLRDSDNMSFVAILRKNKKDEKNAIDIMTKQNIKEGLWLTIIGI